MVTMKKNSILWGVLPMIAAILTMVACDKKGPDVIDGDPSDIVYNEDTYTEGHVICTDGKGVRACLAF